MARLLENLPPEILENVLACLPVHVLCRLRLVCKKWNYLISQPEFAPRQASYVLFTPKVLQVKAAATEIGMDWEVLDMAENRFYKLSDSFVAKYMILTQGHDGIWLKYTMAAGGGLIYAVYYGREGVDREHHIVCNPVSKDFHRIKEPKPFCYHDSDIVAMLVDNATKSYRIVTVEPYQEDRGLAGRLRRGRVYLYDSTTMQWRKLCEAPPENKYRAYSSIFMGDVFYALFMDYSVAPSCPKLYSCDTETGVWSYIDVKLHPPSSQKDKLQLVMILGRLFYVEYHGLVSSLRRIRRIQNTLRATDASTIEVSVKVGIWEILLAKRELINVTQISKMLSISRIILDERPETILRDHAIAVGCEDSILISSLAHRWKFDLLKNSWYEMPDNTDHMQGTREGTAICHGICAGLVHLDLREMSH